MSERNTIDNPENVDQNNFKKTSEKKDAPEKSPKKRESKKASTEKRSPHSSTRSHRQRLSIRKSIRGTVSNEMKATRLTFQTVTNKPEVARVQLLLCNISDRDIFVKLRCNANSNVSALPASSGHIAPKSQMRIMLNWKMPEGFSNWKDVAMPKILLSTYFLHQGVQSSDESPTNTRLMARVSTSKQCDPDNPPAEQLLLDAVGKDASSTHSKESVVSPTPTALVSTDQFPEDDNMKWIIYALIFLIIVLLLNNNKN